MSLLCRCQRKHEFSARAHCAFKLRLSIYLFLLPPRMTFFEKRCISSTTSFIDCGIVALPTLFFFQLPSVGLNFFYTSIMCWKSAGFIQCWVSGNIFLLLGEIGCHWILCRMVSSLVDSYKWNASARSRGKWPLNYISVPHEVNQKHLFYFTHFLEESIIGIKYILIQNKKGSSYSYLLTLQGNESNFQERWIAVFRWSVCIFFFQ